MEAEGNPLRLRRPVEIRQTGWPCPPGRGDASGHGRGAVRLRGRVGPPSSSLACRARDATSPTIVGEERTINASPLHRLGSHSRAAPRLKSPPPKGVVWGGGV